MTTAERAEATELRVGGPDGAGSTLQAFMRLAKYSLALAIVSCSLLNAAIWQLTVSGPMLLLVTLNDLRGIVVMTAFILLLSLAARRFWVCAAAVIAVSGVLAIVTVLKLRYLREPVMPSDVDYLTAPGFALSMVPWWAVPLTVIALTLWITIGYRFDRRSDLFDGISAGWTIRAGAAAAIVLGAVAGVTFNHSGNPLRLAYDHTGSWSPVNNISNMQTAGFVGGFLSGMPMTPMEVPDGYGAAEMRRIETDYSSLAAHHNNELDAELRPNIVLILGESVADPVGLHGVELTEDPLSAVRDVAARTGHGVTKTFAFGTGTSSMEYQALTGHAVSLFSRTVSSPYHSFVGEHPDYPSLVSMARDRGYETLAIYPGDTSNYKRAKVFRALGFDRFVDLHAMTHRAHVENGRYVSDESMFREVEDHIQRARQPLFAHVLTMQNHSPFKKGTYSDPIDVTGPEGKDEPMGEWARGLAHTSDALARLLERLSTVTEPTLVVYYGDHFPPGLETDVQSYGERAYEAPFVLWSNFGDQVDVPADYGIVGPQYLTALAFDRTGIPEPAMFELLKRMRREVGTPTPRGIVDQGGNLVDPNELTKEQQNLLHDYTLVQYDLSIGRRHAEGLWTIP